MTLQLIDAPDAAGMRPYVSEFIRRVILRHRLPFDYSVASLRIVDRVVDGLRRPGADRARANYVLHGLGAYAGEVLVRRAGACWVDLDREQQQLFRQSVGVRMPDGRVWNPLGKVVNRFEHGPQESLQELYLQLHGRSRQPVQPPQHQGDLRHVK